MAAVQFICAKIGMVSGMGVINGVLASPLLVVIMLVSNNKNVMGKRVNGKLTNFLGWNTTILISVAALGMVLTWGK
jgi:Mn2+/Fe2+ NRAMP family transporter